MYVGHTHSTRRQMYIVCVCVSSTLRVPFRYPSGSLLRSKLDPLASMGWLWVAWALLAVAPAPIEPEARYGFPSGNISTIPDFPVTLDGLSRVVFRLDETSSSNCAPRVEGFHFSPPPAAATAAPTAHGLRDVCHTLPDATRTTSASAFVDFVPHFAHFPPFWGTAMANLEHNFARFSSLLRSLRLGQGPGPPHPNSVSSFALAVASPGWYCGQKQYRPPVTTLEASEWPHHRAHALCDIYARLWAQLHVFYALQQATKRVRSVRSAYHFSVYGTLSDSHLEMPPELEHFGSLAGSAPRLGQIKCSGKCLS